MTRPVKKEVPPELRSILLDFTVGFLLDEPVDIIEYAIEYFKKIKESREEQKAVPHFQEEVLLQEEVIEVPTSKRRKSVFAEAYNPEEDDEEEEIWIYPKTETQRRDLRDTIKDVLIFSSLDDSEISQILDAMFEKNVQKGDVIIQEGTEGDNFYVIETGVYEVSTIDSAGEKKVLATYNNKGSFGELALLYRIPRKATVVALTDGVLWALGQSTFRRIVLKSAFLKRKRYEAFIEKVPMLKALQSYERMNLADALAPREFSDGDLIIKQGDTADGMYFVESGKVKITVVADSEEMDIRELQSNEYFGELALITHRPRAGNAYSIGHSKLAFLDVKAFERLLGPCMDILKRNIYLYETQLSGIYCSNPNIVDH